MGDELQLPGVDFRAVLGAFEVAHLGREAVDAAVEPSHLGVEAVDEAPEQGFALVAELEAVRGRVAEDAERYADCAERASFVPDLAGVELAALGGCAVELGLLADDGGRGLGAGPVVVAGLDGGGGVEVEPCLCEGVCHRGVGAVGVVHDVLLIRK